MPENQRLPAGENYAGLVQFLIEPFLESPESLKIDCEILPSKPRVWIRLAIDGEDKGRVFGRGGRNIQAIRTVLEASARFNGQTLYLDIYGSGSERRESPPSSGSRVPPSRPSRPPSHRPEFPSRSSPRFRSP